MGKKVNKGFFSYLFIFLGIALACVLICAIIMFFSPGTKIFGISYYNLKGELNFEEVTVYNSSNEIVKNDDGSNKTIEINTFETNVSQFKTIEINSNIFDVEFVQRSTSTSESIKNLFKIAISCSTQGYTKQENNKLKFTPKYFEDSKKLQINLEAPVGFLSFGNNCKVIVKMPADFSSELNIVVNSESGNVKLGGTSNTNEQFGTLNASSLNIKTNKGKIYTTKLFEMSTAHSTIDSSLETESGNIEIGQKLVANNLNITTKTGAIKLIDNEIQANTFTCNAENAFITLDNIIANKIDFNVKYGKIYAKQLQGNVEFTDKTSNCDLQADTITGFLKIGTMNEESISTKSNIDVTLIKGEIIACTTGNINIGEIQSTSQLRTAKGEINIPKVNGILNITTVSSNIVLGKIVDKNGKFIANGITKKIVIEGSEKTNVSAYFNEVETDSSIITKSGEINAYFTPTASAKITATAKSIVLTDGKNNPQNSPFNYSLNAGTQTLILTSKENNVNIIIK